MGEGRRRAMLLVAVTTAAAATALGCVAPDPGVSTSTTAPDPIGQVQVLVTTGDRSRLLADGAPLPITPHLSGQSVSITVDTTQQFQTMAGAGAALTDSSASLLAALDDTARQALLEDLFGPDGAQLGYLRVPISSSDFSLEDYTYDDVELPDEDVDLSGFSLARDEARTFPLLTQIRSVRPDVGLMASAWSAPGWMKDDVDRSIRSGLIGGTLADEHVDTYARYLRMVAQGYAGRGLAFDAMTVQNEPAHSPPDYAGMLLAPEQEARLAERVGSELDAAGLDTQVLVHDHNWDLTDRALDVLHDPAASPHVDGVAFHCYGGDPSAQEVVHDAHPTKDVYFTECTGTLSSGTFSSNLMWNTNTLMIGATRNWARTVLLWNLALDPTGGPRVGGCPDCRGVVTIDPATGDVTRNEEYYALAHLGRALAPDAVRVASTASSGAVRSVAFVHPDGTRSMLLSNDSGAAATVSVREGDRRFRPTVPARGVLTLTWPDAG